MRKRSFLLIFLLGITLIAEDDFEIKSLRVYQSHDETSFPVVFPNSKIAIEFDIKSDHTPSWEILFRYCDQYW